MIRRAALAPQLWLLLLVLAFAANLRAAIVSVSPLLSVVERDLHAGPLQASLLGMLAPLVFAVAGFGSAWVLRRFGLERAAWIAMALCAAGQLARSFVPSASLFLVYSAVALAGLGVGNVVAPPLVKKYFPHRLGLVTGLYVVAIQLGSALPPQLAVQVADSRGWRTSIGIWAIPAAAAMLGWIVADRWAARRASLAGAAATGTTGPRPAGDDLIGAGGGPAPATIRFADMARSRIAWGLVALFGMQSLMAYALIAWLPTMLRDAGVSPAVGGSALATFAVCQIPMSLLAPVLVARLRNPFSLIVVFAAAFAGAYAGMALAPASAPLLWAALFGIGSGPFPVGLALIGLRTRTTAGAAALSSFAQGMSYLAACLGPLVCGLIADVTGEWTLAQVFLGVLLVPMVAGGWVICKPELLEDDLARIAARRGSPPDLG